MSNCIWPIYLLAHYFFFFFLSPFIKEGEREGRKWWSSLCLIILNQDLHRKVGSHITTVTLIYQEWLQLHSPIPRGWQLSNYLTDQQKRLSVCFLEPPTHNICVARESLLTSKPTLKALLLLTDASFGFIGTYIKKKQLYSFWRLLLYLPLQREKAGSGAA